MFNGLLPPKSTIAELGSANGRDARYWAQFGGHTVHCLDFSQVALDQLVMHAVRQGVADLIKPWHFDANSGRLPKEVDSFDGFYARSALHVDDATLMALLADVDSRLRPQGVVFIEGKSTHDTKIARSINLGNGLAVDPEENGHLRRIWSPETLQQICRIFGWISLNQDTIKEKWAGTDATFLRLVATK
ncbi:class I SAM-dependent methyltransferase [Candidatus Saccharibacteria bacterium]|nr:MAG: class I SAM-dependent methyltransferase [Candidatus Saccharibacteria bacterium]